MHSVSKFSILISGLSLLFYYTTDARAQSDESVVALLGIDLALLDIGRNKRIKVEIDDQVIEGCWRNPNSARDAVEVELMRSGFEIIEDSQPGPVIVLMGLGGESSGTNCSVFLNFDVFSYTVEERTIDEHRLFSFF